MRPKIRLLVVLPIKAELSSDWYTAYMVLVPVEALLPAVAVMVVLGLRLRAMNLAAQARRASEAAEDLDGLSKH